MEASSGAGLVDPRASGGDKVLMPFFFFLGGVDIFNFTYHMLLMLFPFQQPVVIFNTTPNFERLPHTEIRKFSATSTFLIKKKVRKQMMLVLKPVILRRISFSRTLSP